MALTITQRPQGHKIGTTPATANTTSAYASGDAYFVDASHGLVDGDYIYAVSDVEEYNGFWYVDQVNTDGFKLKAAEESTDYLQFIASGSVTYYVSDLTHGWSCVHLPIVYKLQSDTFPNTVDALRTVSSFSDDNGYTNLNLSGAVKGTVFELDYIKITGAADEALNGVWQITDVTSSSDITINLIYDSGYSFAGATVQYYYNNYHARVKVFAGLDEDHQWEHLKPFTEIAEIKIIPDENGEVVVSVHEVLKSQMKTRNNLLLATLPLNLDFFTQFYISYAESYDVSDGLELSTYVTPYVSNESTAPEWENETLDPLNLWVETGSGNDWTNTTTPTVSLNNDEDSENLTTAFDFVPGTLYKFLYNFELVSSIGNGEYTVDMDIRVMNNAENTTYFVHSVTSINPTAAGITAEFTVLNSNADKIVIRVRQDQTGVNVTNVFRINSIYLQSKSSEGEGGLGFIGFAANAKLPFKNPYSGYLSNYIQNDWLTLFEEPVIFDDHFFDLSAIINDSGTLTVEINGDTAQTYPNSSPGIYRIPVTPTGEDMTVQLFVDGIPATEVITLRAFNDCEHHGIYLSWLNNLGGFDYWYFTAKKDYLVDIQDAGEMRNNIFPTWPQSYATQADTIRRQTYRVSNKSMVVRSQHLTRAQLDAISYIKSSVLVQIVNSRQDRRTVIVDTDSFTQYRDRDDTYSISFTIQFTDDIPSQTI